MLATLKLKVYNLGLMNSATKNRVWGSGVGVQDKNVTPPSIPDATSFLSPKCNFTVLNPKP